MPFFLKFIDKMNEWTGKLFAWLVVFLAIGLMYEVIARYAFNAPTVWSYDITYMLYGAHFMMGAGYCLYVKGHVRVDVFYRLFSPRWQAIADCFFYLILFFPAITVLFIYGIEYAAFAWQMQEASYAGAWRPPIYPIKTVLPLAALLLLLQGVAEFIRTLGIAVRRKQYGN